MSVLQDDVAVVFNNSIDKASSGVASHPAYIFAFSAVGVQHHKNQPEAGAFTIYICGGLPQPCLIFQGHKFICHSCIIYMCECVCVCVCVWG